MDRNNENISHLKQDVHNRIYAQLKVWKVASWILQDQMIHQMKLSIEKDDENID